MFFHLIGEEVYVIGRRDYIDPKFFLREIMVAPDAAIDFCALWTANPVRAEGFKTEEAVEEFKAQWLRRYVCEIIRIRV